MKYVAITKKGAIPVAARVSDEKAKELTSGAWHYVTKSKYKQIREESKRIKEARRKAAEKAATLPDPLVPQPKILAMAIGRSLQRRRN